MESVFEEKALTNQIAQVLWHHVNSTTLRPITYTIHHTTLTTCLLFHTHHLPSHTIHTYHSHTLYTHNGGKFCKLTVLLASLLPKRATHRAAMFSAAAVMEFPHFLLHGACHCSAL